MEDNEELTDPTSEVWKANAEDSSDFSGPAAPPDGTSIEKWRIHLEASRRLAAMGGTMPDLEDIPRRRADQL
jgi:hypothetical protein